MAARKKAAALPAVKAEAVAPATVEASAEVVQSIKGFDFDWKCRDYQFALGGTYTHTGTVRACNSGFHAVEGNPLDVFGYYPPGISRYAETEQSGTISRDTDDSKIASASITVKAELHLPALIERAIKWLFANCKDGGQHATGDQSAASSTGDQSAASSTGDQSAASSTGDQSAASSTGYQSAASSTGDQSAASSTGDQSAASSTGDQSAASSTGDQSAASSTGDQSAAMASGRWGRAMAEKDGCALFLVHRNDDWKITHTWSGLTGRDGIKAGVWYQLGENGQPVEVSA